MGKYLRYFTGRGFFKMIQISLFDVALNIIGHVFLVFAQKIFCVDLIFFVPNLGFTLENPNWPIFYVFVARFLRYFSLYIRIFAVF
jgi:hypothetical protein